MITRVSILAGLLLAALSLTALSAEGDKAPVISWKKTVIDPTFRSEGCAIADVNKDGKMDILVGDVWYEAPDWKMHEVRKPGNWGNGLGSYSECMCCWADDINGDGYPDQIVVGFPGKPAYWYENPKGKTEGHWTEHELWHSACNETPTYTDLLGNGKKVLVMGWQPKGSDGKVKEDQGQMAYFTPGKDPAQAWEMHPISEPSAPGKEVPGTRRFSHGLGVADLNGDGKKDVICTGGWWEQPDKVTDKPWKFHPAELGDACADMYTLDMDGDGKLDVLSTSAHKFGIWWYQQREGKEHPSFIKKDLFRELMSETHAAHFVDINGDGLKDLVTGKRWWSHGRSEPGSDWPAMVYWFEASKDKSGLVKFTPRIIDTDSGIGTQFTVADFNGDGLLDVIVANKKGVFLTLQVRNGETGARTKEK